MATRGGAFLLAGAAALIAALLLLVFAQQYRESVKEDAAPSGVLIARSLIAKGSSGDQIATGRLIATSKIKGSEVRGGALTDAASLRGKTAVADIYPGQQITAADFVTTGDTVVSKLSGRSRAIAIPVDQAHGLIGQVAQGDRVDILASFTESGGASGRPSLRTLLSDVTVLRAPGVSEGPGATGANIVLKVTAKDAVKLAFAADNGKIWVVLRPATGGSDTPGTTESLDSVLSGTQ